MNKPGPVPKKYFTTHGKAIAQVSQQVAEAEMQKTVKKVWDINKAEEDGEKLMLLSLAMEPGQERFPVFVWHGFCD